VDRQSTGDHRRKDDELDYCGSTIALWKRGEREFVDMARIAQQKHAAALIIYNNDDAVIGDLPAMARDDAASPDSQREHFIKIPVLMVRQSKGFRPGPAHAWVAASFNSSVLTKMTMLDAQISQADGLEIKRLLAERDANVIATLPSSVPDCRSMVLRLPLYMPTSDAAPEASREPYAHVVDLSSNTLKNCLQEDFVRQAFEDQGLGAYMVPLCNRMNLRFDFGLEYEVPKSLRAWCDQYLTADQKRAVEVVIGHVHHLKQALDNRRGLAAKWLERLNATLCTFPGALLQLKTQVRCLNICCDELEEISELLGRLHFRTALVVCRAGGRWVTTSVADMLALPTQEICLV